MRKVVEQTFCWKINSELKLFKHRMLSKTKEEIYGLAYQIDCMLNLYEILLELSQKLETEQLKKCICIPELLAVLYQEWLKIPDSQNEEMEHTVRSYIQDQCNEETEKEVDGNEETDSNERTVKRTVA